MNSKIPSSASDRVYQDFQPTTTWITEESKTLEIPLPGFRKEQVRVQLDNLGNLKLSGERPLEGNKWSRFTLNMRIPKECRVEQIHAKFNNNILQVVLPKKTLPTNVLDHHSPAQQQDPTSQKIANDYPKKTKANKAENENETGQVSYHIGLGGYVVTVNKPTRVFMVNVAVAVIMLVAAGAYAVQRLRSEMARGDN